MQPVSTCTVFECAQKRSKIDENARKNTEKMHSRPQNCSVDVFLRFAQDLPPKIIFRRLGLSFEKKSIFGPFYVGKSKKPGKVFSDDTKKSKNYLLLPLLWEPHKHIY